MMMMEMVHNTPSWIGPNHIKKPTQNHLGPAQRHYPTSKDFHNQDYYTSDPWMQQVIDTSTHDASSHSQKPQAHACKPHSYLDKNDGDHHSTAAIISPSDHFYRYTSKDHGQPNIDDRMNVNHIHPTSNTPRYLSTSNNTTPHVYISQNIKLDDYPHHLKTVSISFLQKKTHCYLSAQRNACFKTYLAANVTFMELFSYYDLLAHYLPMNEEAMHYIALMDEVTTLSISPDASTHTLMKPPTLSDSFYLNPPNMTQARHIFAIRHHFISLYPRRILYLNKMDALQSYLTIQQYSTTHHVRLQEQLSLMKQANYQKSNILMDIFHRWNTSKASRNITQTMRLSLLILIRRLKQLPHHLCDLINYKRCFNIIYKRQLYKPQIDYQNAVHSMLVAHRWLTLLNMSAMHADTYRFLAPQVISAIVDKVELRTQSSIEKLLLHACRKKEEGIDNNDYSHHAHDQSFLYTHSTPNHLNASHSSTHSNTSHSTPNHLNASHPSTNSNTSTHLDSSDPNHFYFNDATIPKHFRMLMFELTIVTLLGHKTSEHQPQYNNTIHYSVACNDKNHEKLNMSKMDQTTTTTPHQHSHSRTMVVLCNVSDFETRAQQCHWYIHQATHSLLLPCLPSRLLQMINLKYTQLSSTLTRAIQPADLYFSKQTVHSDDLWACMNMDMLLAINPSSLHDRSTSTHVECHQGGSQIDLAHTLTHQGRLVAVVMGFNPEQPGECLMESLDSVEEELWIRTDLIRILRQYMGGSIHGFPVLHSSLDRHVSELMQSTYIEKSNLSGHPPIHDDHLNAYSPHIPASKLDTRQDGKIPSSNKMDVSEVQQTSLLSTPTSLSSIYLNQPLTSHTPLPSVSSSLLSTSASLSSSSSSSTASLSASSNQPSSIFKPLYQSLHIPNLWCFRDAMRNQYAFRKEPYQLNAIMYRCNPYWFDDKSHYRYSKSVQIDIIYGMIFSVLESAYEHGYDTLVVDSLGCGSQYGQHPLVVARCWKVVLHHHPYWRDKFKNIHFVIPAHYYTSEIGESLMYDDFNDSLFTHLHPKCDNYSDPTSSHHSHMNSSSSSQAHHPHPQPKTTHHSQNNHAHAVGAQDELNIYHVFQTFENVLLSRI